MARQPHELFDTREQKADLEARNGLLQFEFIEALVSSSKNGFVFSPALMLELHRLAIQNIYICSGTFRTQDVVLIRNGVVDYSKHQPLPWGQVLGLVEEMCEYINKNFGRLSGIHLASYVMWRMNWIHPFMGGNGRSSRAASYLLLNVRMGFNLPGINTIAQQIEKDRAPYYQALILADEAFKQGLVDVSAMEELLSRALAAQLLSVHQKATNA
jgi:Fic family protein